MMSDDEDDAHYCLKCHKTIDGLDNYIKHRKTICNKLINIQSTSNKASLKPLKADDFFSSLELQSSSKKVPIPSTSGKQSFGILTRSKTSGATPKPNKNVWIHSDNNTKLLKPVDNTDKISFTKKDHVEEDEFENSFEFTDPEEDFSESEDDGNYPPKSFTGGKWKPSSPISEWVEDGENSTGAKWRSKGGKVFLAPPHNHTKGKWKPSSPVSEWADDENSTGGKWRSKSGKVFLAPPQNHTKGKWKPMSPIQTLKDYPSDFKEGDNNFFILSEKAIDNRENDTETITNTWSSLSLQQPPPNYTKGKWKPTNKKDDKIKNDKKKISETTRPFRKFNGGVQYWCGICNRSLASKFVYARHLKSDLHLRRAGHENDLEELNPKKIKRINKTIESPKTLKPKRFRRKKYIRCIVCRSRVIFNQMGKHLISHYHCRRGDITTDEAKEMVLENIDQIVLHSPFQCGLCQFYCNSAEDFLTHWNSQFHTDKAENSSGYFLCSFCQFSTHDNIVMQNHLNSEEHNEVIYVINRSVPIIIRSINPIKCQTCSVSFLLNIQLRKHCELHGHDYCDTASDGYQKKQLCKECNKGFKSKTAYQRHVLKYHDRKYYFCSICEVSFDTQEEIIEHRRTIQHRTKLQEKGKIPKQKSCDYCDSKFENIKDLKVHLNEFHPEYAYNCPYCDKKFAISQDLIAHIRTKKCKISKEEKAHSCERCYYSTNSLADLWYHNALHEGPVKDTTLLDKVSKYSDMYKCIVCSKAFPKASLKFHLKNHTNEKAFKCEKCGYRFARKNNWKLHMKNHEMRESSTRFLCAVCGKEFLRNSLLKKHMLTHSGKLFRCDANECSYIATTSAMLNKHMKIHTERDDFSCEKCSYIGKSIQQLRRHSTAHESVKKFTCSQCPFTTRLGFHLRRHERIHSGAKPYLCPHCPYRCNNLENLRKHVLSTGKHPGKYLYKCKFCPSDKFQTNFAKEFKVHLMTFHGNVFQSANKATSYIGGIYDCNETSAGTETSVYEENIDADNVVAIVSPLELEQNTNKPSISTQESLSENKPPDDLFSMLIVTKDETIVYLDKDAWNSVSNFDVEESEALSFNEDEGSILFQEHFQS